MGHAAAPVEVKDPGSLTLSKRYKTMYSIFIFIGVVSFAMMMFKDADRAWYAYLIGLFYTVTLALGGLFLSAIHHMTSSGWSVNVRRLFESFTAFLPVGFIAALIFIFVGAPQIYEWLDAEIVAKDALIQHKEAYLNAPFFWVRTIGFFLLWLLFRKWIVGRSLEQDKTGDESITAKLVRPSIAFIFCFALSYSFFSVDMLMSLDSHWFSTIYGVYHFGGMFQTTIALTIIMIAYLNKKGLLRGFVNENHLHDLGKYLFAFTVFWAYIAFSQFMLIWYANIPEETFWYKPRMKGTWAFVSIALILFKFIVPFFALLPQWAKRNINHLVAVSVLILVMQFVDLFWLTYPKFDSEVVRFGIGELGVFAGFIGMFFLSVGRFLSRHSVVAHKDPRIQESMSHHVVY